MRAVYVGMVALLAGVCCSGCTANKATSQASDRDQLYQYSIIDALMAGVYDGDVTIGELKSRGDFGLGTFNALDGELYFNEGVVHRIAGDGSVNVVADDVKAPLAFVKHFKADRRLRPQQTGLSRHDLEQKIVEQLDGNSIYAIRITGRFTAMKTRAPAPAAKPYPELQVHLQSHQQTFASDGVEGTCVGFYIPAFMAGTNVPGYHFHFLSDDETFGGHVIDFTADAVVVELDKASGYTVTLVDSDAFQQADLAKDRTQATTQVEKGR